MNARFGSVVLSVLLTCQLAESAEKPAWTYPKTVDLDGLASLSSPVLVTRSQGYCWFPTLVRTGTGDLLALMSNYADVHTSTATALSAWSSDGGLTWSKTKQVQYGDSSLQLPNGELMLLPYYLRPRKDVIAAPYQLVPKGKRELRVVEEGVTVSGWSKPLGSFEPKLGLAGFVFNGQTLTLKDGGFLAMLYGYFEKDKRYSLVAVESKDGKSWKVRSLVAGPDCKLKGAEGPCESAACRLKDQQLMCVFRMNGGEKYGQCFSRDEGKTWTEPAAMDAFSVQPSLVVLKDGTVILSGGRPGLYLWINRDGDGKSWQRVNLQTHHNTCKPMEQIIKSNHTSSYTEVVAVDDAELLVIYDRIPNGWAAIPKDSKESNSVWVVRIRLSR
jgi:hypothetical protein